MIDVAIIVGSTRPGRKAEAVAVWIHGIASKRQPVLIPPSMPLLEPDPALEQGAIAVA